MSLSALLVRSPDERKFTAYEEGATLAPGTAILVRLRHSGGTAERHRSVGVKLTAKGPAGDESTWIRCRAHVRRFLRAEVPDGPHATTLLEGTAHTVDVPVEVTSGERVLLRPAPAAPRRDARRGGKLSAPELPDGCTVRLVPFDPDAYGRARRWVARLEIGSKLPSGWHTATVRVVSDARVRGGDDGFYGTSSNVRFRIAGPIVTAEHALGFGLVRLDSERADRTRTLRLLQVDRGADLARVTASVESEGADWIRAAQVTLVEAKDGRSAELRIELPLPRPSDNGVFRGRVRIDSGVEDEPPHFVPLSGVLR
ncbi:MAG: hypothetical protein AAFR54_01095 [Planctomycetota bacterium]